MSEVMWVWDYELKTLGSWPSTGYNGHNTPVEVVTQMDVKVLRDERDRLREALEKIVAGIDHYGADHILRKQYLADDEWWSLKRGGHSFPLWIAWMALKQAALTPAGQRWTWGVNT